MINETKRKGIVVIIKWLVGLVALAFLFKHLEVSEISSVIARADKRYLASGILITVIIRIFYAWQTALAIRHQGLTLTIYRALVVNTIAGFYALFLPGGLSGGAVKWYKFSKPTGKRSEVLAAIIYIRLLNTILFLLFGIIGLLIDNPLDSDFLFGSALFFLILLAGLYVLFLSNRFEWSTQESFQERISFLPLPMINMFSKLSRSLFQYRSLTKKAFSKMVLVTFTNLALTILLFYVVGHSLDLTMAMYTLPWIVAMVYLIQMIPISISGLGLREGSLVLVLPYYGVDPSTAIVFSLILFGLLLLMGLAGGILELREFIRD